MIKSLCFSTIYCLRIDIELQPHSKQCPSSVKGQCSQGRASAFWGLAMCRVKLIWISNRITMPRRTKKAVINRLCQLSMNLGTIKQADTHPTDLSALFRHSCQDSGLTPSFSCAPPTSRGPAFGYFKERAPPNFFLATASICLFTSRNVSHQACPTWPV